MFILTHKHTHVRKLSLLYEKRKEKSAERVQLIKPR